jgi:hypothetical protein
MTRDTKRASTTTTTTNESILILSQSIFVHLINPSRSYIYRLFKSNIYLPNDSNPASTIKIRTMAKLSHHHILNVANTSTSTSTALPMSDMIHGAVLRDDNDVVVREGANQLRNNINNTATAIGDNDQPHLLLQVSRLRRRRQRELLLQIDEQRRLQKSPTASFSSGSGSSDYYYDSRSSNVDGGRSRGVSTSCVAIVEDEEDLDSQTNDGDEDGTLYSNDSSGSVSE